MSFLLKLFGLDGKEEVEKTPFERDPDALYLREDNYLMLEILPKENLNGSKQEDQSKENYAGLGYNMVTPDICTNGVKIIDKLIDVNSVLSVINESQLKKVEKIGVEGLGFFENDEEPYAFGNKKYGLLLNEKSGLLDNLWIEGQIEGNDETEIQELVSVLFALGQIFDFAAVNWYTSTYFDLSDREEAEAFVRSGLIQI